MEGVPCIQRHTGLGLSRTPLLHSHPAPLRIQLPAVYPPKLSAAGRGGVDSGPLAEPSAEVGTSRKGSAVYHPLSPLYIEVKLGARPSARRAALRGRAAALAAVRVRLRLRLRLRVGLRVRG